MTTFFGRPLLLWLGLIALGLLTVQIALATEVPNASKRPKIDEIRKATEIPRSTESPKVGEVIRSADGKLASFLKAKQVCSKDGKCHEAVTDSRTQVLTAFDDKWMPGIKSTGDGQKLVRAEIVTLHR